jgi:enamine deaminase RidA (YjgF/YER057c/UK114 family)
VRIRYLVGDFVVTERRSINIDGFSHGQQPIPAASRVGPLVITGGVYGLDPKTGLMPDDVDEQAALMFANLGRIIAEAGGSLDSIARMTVYVKVPEARAAVNREWLAAFPNADARPARHTLSNDGLPSNMLVQCDAVAWVEG